MDAEPAAQASASDFPALGSAAALAGSDVPAAEPIEPLRDAASADQPDDAAEAGYPALQPGCDAAPAGGETAAPGEPPERLAQTGASDRRGEPADAPAPETVAALAGSDVPAAAAVAPDPPDATAAASAPDPALFAHALRLAEALVFASDRPVTPQRLQQALPPGVEARAVLTALAAHCADRPVQLVEVAGGFAFRTAPELAPALTRVVEVPRRLPRAAMETLAIIAYHQPVTRAEIEEIRGASLSQTTLEALLEMSLIAPRGRKEVPGRPSLWGTTPKFLEQFGLRALSDLPRREELVNEPGSPLLAPAEAPPPA